MDGAQEFLHAASPTQGAPLWVVGLGAVLIVAYIIWKRSRGEG